MGGTYALTDLENINISQNYCSTGTNFTDGQSLHL